MSLTTLSSTTPGLTGIPTPPSVAPNPPWISRIFRLTVRQYDQMVQDGVIGAKDKVELIEGLLVSRMGRNRPHIAAGNVGLRTLERIVPVGWYIAKEDPVVVSEWSKPEPDLAIVRGQARDYIDRDVMATDLALVVEIADSTLSADQKEMKRVYSASGIPVYWIVNLVDRQLEIYTDPTPDGYPSSLILKPGQNVSVVIGGVVCGPISVSEILP
jgi:Uma2 family endonuclease